MTTANFLDPSRFLSEHQNLLLSLPLLADIPYPALYPVLLKCDYQFAPARMLLITPQQFNQHLYVLLSGQLMAHIHADDLEKGFVIQAGEFVGEVSFIDNQAPTSYVTASQDCLLLCIPETLFWTEFLLIPGVSKNLLRLINIRTRARNQALQKSLEQEMRLELLEKELLIAQELQANMLPQRPLFATLSGMDVDAMMKAAKEVGGDLYDAFILDDDRICVAIGDVAGKGIPAALFMMRSITILRNEMLMTKDLLQTIRTMNMTLCQNNTQCMFVTLTIFVLNLSSGELQYVNGGHNRSFLGNFAEGFKYLEQPKGILVGINPAANFQVASINLKPGDTLIAYTDGITEANNLSQEEYSEQRLLNLINSQPEHDANGLINRILEDVHEFVGGADQSDDLTLLILRYLSSGKTWIEKHNNPRT